MVKHLRDGWTRLPEALRFSLPVWLAARLLTTLFGFWIWKLRSQPLAEIMVFYEGLQPITKGWRGMFFGIWQRWDTVYYQTIVEKGYVTEKSSAFFPLYPLTAKILSRLTGLGSLECLYLVSTLAYLAAIVLLYALIKEKFNSTIARRSVMALAVFPSSFFFLALYPQGLGLALVLFAILLAEKRYWFGCAIVSWLAGLTHSTALPLSLILLAEAVIFIRQNTHPWRCLALLVVGMPALGIGLFWAWRINQNFPPIITILTTEFDRYPAPPWNNLLNWVAMLPHHLLAPDWLINSIALILTVASIIWTGRRISIGWALYQVALLIMVLGIGVNYDPLLSYNRYILSGFPIFTMLGWWVNTPVKRLIGFTLGVFGQVTLLLLFLLWAWVG